MTRTIRIYNKPVIKKAQRYNLDGDDIHPLFGCYLSYPVGIPYTRRSWICMGHCPQCRDKNREPSLIRKRNKEQFMFELRLESNEPRIRNARHDANNGRINTEE